MTAHVYSSVPVNSRAVYPVSLGSSPTRYSDPNYGLYYNGFVIVSSPFVRPPGFYLAPVPSNPQNQVDVWIHSLPWHGRPLVQVVQSEGSFTQSSDDGAAMPLNGYIKLDMYMNTLTQIYENPWNSNWWYS